MKIRDRLIVKPNFPNSDFVNLGVLMQHTALIVDDDQHTLVLLTEVLKPTGIQVLQAEDGAQALQILATNTPSIILLDMLMPRVTGHDVLNYVSRTPRLDDMYVVVISAHRYFEADASLERANAYLVKPIRPKDIRYALELAISKDS